MERTVGAASTRREATREVDEASRESMVVDGDSVVAVVKVR